MSLQIKGDNYPRSITYLGDHETKWTINNIVAEVMRGYEFSSLTEFNAVLRQYNVMGDCGKEEMTMFKKNSLLHTI